MKLKRLFNKALACVVALTLLTPAAFVPIPVYASDFTDTSSHWADKYIKSAIGKGFAKGYSDGTFKPDKAVTRAEFSAMLNKAFGKTGTATISFSDVSSADWYYSDISKAVAATYVSGYSDNSFKPNNQITREEAAVIISRIVPNSGSLGNLNAFGDSGSISGWALAAMQKSYAGGYIGAYNDGKLHPKDRLTRAQAVKIICDMTQTNSVTFDPFNGEKNVSANKKITITFSRTITKYDGKEIANSDLVHLVKLREERNNGIEVPFVATINSAKNVITITPDKSLKADMKYYLTIDRNVFKYENGDGNDAQSIYFTVGTDAVDGVTFSPANGATGIKTTIEPTITFDFAVKTYSDNNITAEYLEKNIEFRKNSADGTELRFTASINSGSKIMTIVPADKLIEGQKYYLGFGSKAFLSDVDKKLISGHSVTWTAGATDPTISFDPANGASKVSPSTNISVKFSEKILNSSGSVPNSAYISGAITMKDNTSDSKIPYSTSLSEKSGSIITIDPTNNLIVGHNYTLTVAGNSFRNAGGKYTAASTTTFTVSDSIDIAVINTAITRAQNAKIGVAQSETGKDVYNNVYWVPSVQLNALDSAISTAANAKTIVRTAAEASSAASALDAVTTAFEKSKKLGLKIMVDTTEIDKSIEFANLVKKGVVISEDGSDVETTKQWVTPALMSALNDAIAKATNAKATVQTEEEVKAVYLELNWVAAKHFDLEKKYGTKENINSTKLASAINNAYSLKNATEISADGQDIPADKYWAPIEVLKDFDSDIYKAKQVLLNSSATHAEIDLAESAVNAASEAFAKARQRGMKAN